MIFYFYKSKNYRDGMCKSCRNQNNKNWRRNTYTDNEYYEREKLIKEGKNKCYSCEDIKPLNSFHKSNHVKTGYRNTCKKCFKIQDKNNKLKVNYNINLDIYNQLLKKQNNSCNICKTKFNKDKDACVDHNHDTKKVRGLLCNTCNRALGLLKDDEIVLYAAIRYLKRHSSE